MSDAQAHQNIPDHVPPELVIDFDAANDSGLKFDIFERLKNLRDTSPPIAYTPHGGGHWLFFRERDVQTALSDTEHFSTSLYRAGFNRGAPDMIPLCLDPPEHLPWRMVVVRQLTPAKIRRLEVEIRAKAEAVIHPLAGQTSCDFMRAVAEQIPIAIFMALMGLPPEGFEEFRSLVLQITSPAGQNRQAEATAKATARVIEILLEVIEARRQEPKDDLVSALLGERIRGEPIGARELLSICYVLFLGGLDTITNAMTYGMRFLAMDVALQDQVRADPGTIPDLVEKLLRKSIHQSPMRLVKRDIKIDGVQLKAGEIVWPMSWPASNTPGGETDGPRHLAFGAGNHLCAGMHLARLELRIMYETWFRHIGRFTLAPDTGPTMSGGLVMQIKRLLLNLNP
jgi:cytochrome P450